MYTSLQGLLAGGLIPKRSQGSEAPVTPLAYEATWPKLILVLWTYILVRGVISTALPIGDDRRNFQYTNVLQTPDVPESRFSRSSNNWIYIISTASLLFGIDTALPAYWNVDHWQLNEPFSVATAKLGSQLFSRFCELSLEVVERPYNAPTLLSTPDHSKENRTFEMFGVQFLARIDADYSFKATV